MIRCTCPQGHTLKVKDSYAGKWGKCPKCGTKFQIPAAEGVSAQDQNPDDTESIAGANHDPYEDSYADSFDDAESRISLVTQYRSALISTLTAAGGTGLNGSPPATMSADLFQFALTGAQGNGAPLHVRVAVVFGNNTYFYEVVSVVATKADRLIAFASDITELKTSPIADGQVATDSGSPSQKMVANAEPESVAIQSKPQTSPTSPTVTSKSPATAVANSPANRPANTPPPKPTAPLPSGDYDTVELSAPVFDTAIGRGGSLLLLHLDDTDEAAVLDLSKREIVGRIPAPQNSLSGVVLTPAGTPAVPLFASPQPIRRPAASFDYGIPPLRSGHRVIPSPRKTWPQTFRHGIPGAGCDT